VRRNKKIVKSGLDGGGGIIVRWGSAMGRCEALTLGSYAHWRVPNINELKSIIVDTKAGAYIDGAFVNTASSSYWSSTTDADESRFVWHVSFQGGNMERFLKDRSCYVRCVRAGE